jgi:hypothetical protein
MTSAIKGKGRAKTLRIFFDLIKVTINNRGSGPIDNWMILEAIIEIGNIERGNLTLFRRAPLVTILARACEVELL